MEGRLINNKPLRLKKYRTHQISFDRRVFVVHWDDVRGNSSGIIIHDDKEYEYIESNNPCDGTENVELITKLKHG